MKIGTKPYARSRRNKLTVVTGLWTGRWTSDQTLRSDAGWRLGRQATGREDRTLVATDRTQERSVRSSTVRLERHICDRTRPVVGDRTLDSVRSVFCWFNGRDDRTRPVRTIQRPVSSSFAGVRPQQLLSQWGL